MRDDNAVCPPRFTLAAGLIACLAAGCYADRLPQELRHLGVPRVEAIEVRPLKPVTLTPGATVKLSLLLQRNGNEGPIAVSLPDLPPGVESSCMAEIPADRSELEIVLTGSPDLGDRETNREVAICLTMDGQAIEPTFNLKLPRVSRPTIGPLPPVFLQPGDAIDLLVPMARNGCAEPLAFEPLTVPEGIVCRLPEEPLAGNHLTVHLEAAGTATEMQLQPLLTTKVYGREVSTPLPLIVARHPFRLPTVPVVTLKPGESRQIELPVARDPLKPFGRLLTGGVQAPAKGQLVSTVFRGAISLTAATPAEAITVAPTTVVADGQRAAVSVAASASARPGAVTVGLRATAEHLEAPGLLVVRVADPATVAAELPDPIVEAFAPGIRIRPGGVAGRTTAESRRLLGRRYGQSKESREALVRALDWLAAAQASDGSWRPTGNPGGLRLASHRVADSLPAVDQATATALAVLPFLAEGVTHEPGSATAVWLEAYPEVVARGLLWLGSRQIEASRQTPGLISETLAGQAWSLIVFSEAYALSGDRRLAKHAKLAARQLVDRQADDGGWAQGDTATPAATLAATARACRALLRAKACGVGVSTLALRRAEETLAALTARGLTPMPAAPAALGGPFDAAATAACLLALQIAEPAQDRAGLLAGAEGLAWLAPALEAERCGGSVGFLRDAGELLRNLDGESFDRWNALVSSFLCRRQLREGRDAGSWNPADFAGSSDRVQTTALATVCLQVAYRTLPDLRR